MRSGLALIVAFLLSLQAVSIAAAEPPLLILMPGGSGVPKSDGFLIRNRARLERAGFQIAVSSNSGQTLQAAKGARAKGRKVFLIGISLGVSRAAAALKAGAPIDAVVFYSGAYSAAQQELGSPRKLPPTLMVHHRQDKCPVTTPASAEAFKRWAGGRVTQLVWISSSGDTHHWICGPKAAHGFFEKDIKPIAAAIRFLKGR